MQTETMAALDKLLTAQGWTDETVRDVIEHNAHVYAPGVVDIPDTDDALQRARAARLLTSRPALGTLLHLHNEKYGSLRSNPLWRKEFDHQATELVVLHDCTKDELTYLVNYAEQYHNWDERHLPNIVQSSVAAYYRQRAIQLMNEHDRRIGEMADEHQLPRMPLNDPEVRRQLGGRVTEALLDARYADVVELAGKSRKELLSIYHIGDGAIEAITRMLSSPE